MAKTHTTWKVLPHGPIEKLSDRLWRIEGSLEGIAMKRVMTVVRRADGSLAIHNAIALGAAEMAELESWGPMRMLIVPNGFHRLDARVFRDRYPDARVVCPAGARAKVEQVVPVSATYDEIADDGVMELQTLDGTKQREGAMIVRAGGTDVSLVFNDAVFNMPHVTGLTGFVLRRLTGSTGGPRVSRIMTLFVISDRAAFRTHLERLAALPGLRRIIVSHHETIDRDPASVLRAVATVL
ncbi:MAG: hypothetical protein H0T89_27605 [Deltaproteobacteria bacterium]|nr:hypothetical protein [Deltaproteobacteria bacterium]